MKIILIGHPGSQHIVPASKYLVEKYLPGFDVVWLNHVGPKENWSKFVSSYLQSIDDQLIIVALDDYLVNSPFDEVFYEHALQKMAACMCCKLCSNTMEELNDYPITTQYCIWNREFLLKILSKTTDPWNFEIEGSRIFKKEFFGAVGVYPCMKYDVHSSLSARWEGINTNGLSDEDINFLKKNKLI